jgi:hypothetical protein
MATCTLSYPHIYIQVWRCISIYITHCIYSHTHKYLYNAVHIHVHIFCIFVNRTDTVRTVSSGKTETDQSNVHAFVYVIINTTLGTVI